MDKEMKFCTIAGFISKKVQMKRQLKKEAKDMWDNKYGPRERNFCRRLWIITNKDVDTYTRAFARLPIIDNIPLAEQDTMLSEKEIKDIKKLIKVLREELDSPEEVIDIV